jgi:hypothetical protein
MEISIVSAIVVVFLLLVMMNLFQFMERAVEALEKQAGLASPPSRFTRRMGPISGSGMYQAPASSNPNHVH